MPDDRKPMSEPDPGVADVVTGPVGSAHLTDPASPDDIDGDVYRLPGADGPTEIPAADSPRQADGQPGVLSDRPEDEEAS